MVDMPARDPKDLLGTVVAERYRLDEIIAMGGMGAVYRAEHVHMHKKVAIKLLHPETKELPELVARFERESIVGAHASHANVASASDFGKSADGTFYLVLEHIEGITLRAKLEEGPLAFDRAIALAREIALGLEAIHQLGIVHRDLAPKNVMITRGGRVKLIDFGFAKVPVEKFSGAQQALALTTKGTVFGTVGFIAPEAAFGMHAVGEKADLYALGVILYEMVAGKHPFDASDQKKLFRAHSFDEPPPPSQRAPQRDIPPAIERIVMRLLQKAPDDRYQDAREVVEQLDAAQRALERGEDGVVEIAAAPEEIDEEIDEASDAASDEAALEDDERDDSPPPAIRPKKRRGGMVFVALLVLAAGAALLAYRSGVWRGTPAAGPTSSVPTTTPSDATVTTASAAPATTTHSTIPTESAPIARPSEIDGLDAAAWKRVLHEASLVHDSGRSAKAIEALAKIDPTVLSRSDVVIDAAAGMVAVALAGGDNADALFALMASDQVEHAGADVLYQVAFRHGGSAGAERAIGLLGRDDVLGHASPAMRIALDLQQTPCRDRPKLFERAGHEGDDRAMLILMNMRDEYCRGCCMRAEPGLAPAIDAIRARLP